MKLCIMSDDLLFEQYKITDEDILWVSGLLGLPSIAFCGSEGNDPRQVLLKSSVTQDVAACPGSGKTTLLVAKLAILAENWEHSSCGICVLSHTNAARHEIEKSLGNTIAGRRLLRYPHFIGTIHAFVNEYLALPWLRSKGYPVKSIDDAIVEKQRRWFLNNDRQFTGLSNYIDKQEKYQNLVGKLIVSSSNFSVVKKGGTPVFSTSCSSRNQLERLAKKVTLMGYHRYDEMFMWAGDLIDTVPDVINNIRNRFPLMFIDEAQDNSELQSGILHRVFCEGAFPVIRQRFGDTNQAIYNSVGNKGAISDSFPDSTVMMNIPNSHRFGQRIADLANPLGVVPLALKGHGPRKPLDSGADNAPNTIFLFSDDTVCNVLDAYGELLLETFSDDEIQSGTFTAVGQIHRPPIDEKADKFPHHVGDYWAKYDPGLVGQDPKPQTFVQYYFAGKAKANHVGESYPIVAKIAEAILCLVNISDNANLRQTRFKHRQILALLDENEEKRILYENTITYLVSGDVVLTKRYWENTLRSCVLRISEAIAGHSLTGTEVNEFLEWKDEFTLVKIEPLPQVPNRSNLYKLSKVGRSVSIRIGSIHSVKGETHTATLVLETYWQDNKGRHNLEMLFPWLEGTQSRKAKKKTGVQQLERMKLHYVAMTRPTHLICLAMKRSTFETGEKFDNEKINAFRKHGWEIQLLGDRNGQYSTLS